MILINIINKQEHELLGRRLWDVKRLEGENERHGLTENKPGIANMKELCEVVGFKMLLVRTFYFRYIRLEVYNRHDRNCERGDERVVVIKSS